MRGFSTANRFEHNLVKAGLSSSSPHGRQTKRDVAIENPVMSKIIVFLLSVALDLDNGSELFFEDRTCTISLQNNSLLSNREERSLIYPSVRMVILRLITFSLFFHSTMSRSGEYIAFMERGP